MRKHFFNRSLKTLKPNSVIAYQYYAVSHFISGKYDYRNFSNFKALYQSFRVTEAARRLRNRKSEFCSSVRGREFFRLYKDRKLKTLSLNLNSLAGSFVSNNGNVLLTDIKTQIRKILLRTKSKLQDVNMLVHSSCSLTLDILEYSKICMSPPWLG